jgi:transposase
MRDNDFYPQILGITYPWFVGEVKLQLHEGEVTVYLELDPDYALSYPLCGKATPGYDTTRRC